jgi:hypothetical protein
MPVFPEGFVCLVDQVIIFLKPSASKAPLAATTPAAPIPAAPWQGSDGGSDHGVDCPACVSLQKAAFHPATQQLASTP